MPHAESHTLLEPATSSVESTVEDIDLYAPIEHDVILQVRTGKMKVLSGMSVASGIDKRLCEGSMWVGKLGIDGDEHDMTFHGGIDKAVHGYCSTHYPSWQKEFPSAATRFVPGGFGENLVTARMNERNVCIGDVFAIGEGDSPLLLQVSLPRQPCYKLNHRFKLKNFAPNTYRLSRTGWYYRVLREGPVQAGDRIQLQERQWPEWTIERIQEYLHRQTDQNEMNEALSMIQELGDESRLQFLQRVTRANAKAVGPPEIKWVDYRVVEKKKQTSRITSFIFEPVTPLDEPQGQLRGAHTKLRLKNNLTRAYSIVSGNRSRFELGISLDEQSRGGSKYLHEQVNVNDVVQVGPFTDGINVNSMATTHVFVVAGVGITAFLALAEALVAINWSVKIHYAVRSSEEVPFRDRLEKLGDRVKIYDKSQDNRLSIDQILKDLTWNSQLYFCGPKRLMDEAALKTLLAGISEKEVHFEAFQADVGGDPFEATIAGKCVTVQVGEDESLLEVLKENFDDFPSSCEVGNCGTCKVRVRSGKIEHRGNALTEEEKADSMLTCVSRGIGKIEIEF